MSKSQRDKGSRGEREVGKLIEQDLGGTCHRTPNSGALDIKGDVLPLGNVLEGWHVECKRQERITMPAWIEQARRDAGYRRWMIPFRRSREPWMVVMELEDFLALVAEVADER